MARRRLLGDEVWARLLDPPADEREVARLYTLTAEDLALVGHRRTDATRLGYALVLLYLRHPGRVLEAGEVPPGPLLAYVARQLGAAASVFRTYAAARDATRREHLAELVAAGGYTTFSRPLAHEVVGLLAASAQTIVRLRWLLDLDLRRRAQAGLNKGEARNALARAIFFCQLGELRDRTFENQVYRASGLNLVVAAVILWNTRYLQLAAEDLAIGPETMRHVAPLGWEHLSLTGDYAWDAPDQPAPGELRPLRSKLSLLAA